MKRKEVIYNVALKEILQLKLDDYHTIFLANLVTRKIIYSEEELNQVISKTMHRMTKIYKQKRNIVEISAKKCKEQLEEALDSANSEVPDEWLCGDMVSNVVKEITKIVIDELSENDTEKSDDE